MSTDSPLAIELTHAPSPVSPPCVQAPPFSASCELAPLEKIARDWHDAKTIVLIGMGGASLGAQAISIWHASARLIFADTLDGETFAALLNNENHFLIISKSGETLETLTQAEMLLAQNPNPEKIRIITEDKPSALTTLAKQHKIVTLAHSKTIGGRFSVLTEVGLLPALLCGADARALQKGAQMASKTQAAQSAAWHIAHAQAGRTISVLMPYSARLSGFAQWHCQLWAESLGKQGKGFTPISALGPADQHSLLQLYSAGADDKSYTIIIPPPQANQYGAVLTASAEAMAAHLTELGRPTRTIRLATQDDHILGALFMHFMLETLFTAEALGINPYDQPAIEAMKQKTRAFLAGTK